MAQRTYLSGNPPRLITSKPGYNASPSLGNIYKTFDSDWFNGAGIRWIFRVSIPSGNPASKTVLFPYALDHVPKYNWMWNGYFFSGAKLPIMRGVEWSVAPDGGAFWATAWQASPGGGNALTPNNKVQMFSNRFEIVDTLGYTGGIFGTLVVYQS
ncbi:hypothetical protein [Brucella sp. 2280]|uniref:hypothetical protein n=1 Tax=Brucella sp. 2280 TaxID=2592625 RepID=UPI0012976752|nr:hypothetical protein [Brucella sp. 2280]QGA55846.1 hypothetical protein GHC20_01585 [Brucella sp. 2280]